jgi:hypothetical protein
VPFTPFLSSPNAVSGPLETACRLEGLLGTIEGRGRDLEAALDRNRQVELKLEGRIQEEMRSEPRHPVITDVAVLGDCRRGDLDDGAQDDGNQGRSMVNVLGPVVSPSAAPERLIAGHPSPLTNWWDSGSPSGSESGSVNSIESRTARVHVGSPVSIDNADLQRNRAIPVYRRAVSEDDLDQFAFGCGVAFLGDGSSSLFSGARSSLAPFGLSTGSLGNVCQSSGNASPLSRPGLATEDYSHPAHDYAAPPSPPSVDGINFRTGLSGHRGLSHLANKSTPSYPSRHSPPSARYRTARLMSEHRGIAWPTSSRLESPPRPPPLPPANAIPLPPSPSAAGSVSSSGATIPALGPRLSSFPLAGADQDP